MPYMKDMKLRRNNLETSMQAKLNRLAEEVSVCNRANDHKSKLEKIVKTKTLPENIQKVLEYDKECEYNGQKLSTRYSTLITIHNLCQFAGKKPFKKFTRTDIVNFLDMAKHRKFEDTRYRARTKNVERELADSSMNHVKYQVKRFFQWMAGMRDKMYPENVSWIDLRHSDGYEELDPEQLPTVEEIKSMIEAVDNPRDRALISLMAESGARVGEISLLQLRDINWNDNGFVLTIHANKSKSKRTRKVPLCVCAEDLKNYINNHHPYSTDKESPVFISYINREAPRSNLKVATIQGIVKRAAKRAGVQKRIHIHPHIFRHARASQLAELNWSEMMLRQYFGWSKTSNMPARYIHMSQRNLNNRYFAMHGKTIPEMEKPQRLEIGSICSKCGTTNPNGYRFCYKCNEVLDKETQEKRKIYEEIKAHINIMATHPSLADQYKELFKQAHEIRCDQQRRGT
jgi:integrase/predicted nucleic acid-binding Zn ribbon protein